MRASANVGLELRCEQAVRAPLGRHGRGPCHQPGLVPRPPTAGCRRHQRPDHAVRRPDGKPAQQLAGHGFGTTMLAWHPSNAQKLAAPARTAWSSSGTWAHPPTCLDLKGGAAWVERLASSGAGSFLPRRPARSCACGTPPASSARFPTIPAPSPTCAGGRAAWSWFGCIRQTAVVEPGPGGSRCAFRVERFDAGPGLEPRRQVHRHRRPD